MATTQVQGGASPRKKIFDKTVAAGGTFEISPGSLAFSIVASAPGGAGTYSIEYALTEELDDWRPLNNSDAVANTTLPNGGTVTARTSHVAYPGVQVLRFTAVTNPTRFIAYGV
jgi:hypothetical protein